MVELEQELSSKNARALSDIKYKRIPAAEISESLLKSCCQLFNNHYGIWSNRGPRPGQRICRAQTDIREYLQGSSAWIATAHVGGRLIGYGCIVTVPCSHGPISWVTQLVVHTDYQNQRIGSTILKAAWLDSDRYAWGIASANPYAIRALEKATRRRCEPAQIKQRRKTVDKILRNIHYLRGCEVTLSDTVSVIDTKFFQDISTIEEKRRLIEQKDLWRLGRLEEGKEWLALTFRKQSEIRLTDDEFSQFLRASHDISYQAYERMAASMARVQHPWSRPEAAVKEVEYILKATGITAPAAVLDFGCGSGRHAIALANMGFDVVGLDFSETAIGVAQTIVGQNNPSFLVGSCLTAKLGRQFALGICLYDVIGSYPDDVANEAILRNLIDHVVPGGWVAISVMSYDYTISIAKHIVKNSNIQERLQLLPVSTTMQDDGEIFNPDYFILDTRSRVCYRRERFDQGHDLPLQLDVRDRRYALNEIAELCRAAGLDVVLCGHVRAGKFELARDDGDKLTKEILVIGRKGLL